MRPFAAVHGLVFAFLLFSLSACQALVPPFRPGTSQNSDPLFFATPVQAGPQPGVPTATTQPGSLEAPEATPAPQAGGELYFVMNDMASGVLSLARLPQDCLLLEVPCPQPENVPGFPNLNETIRPLVWSPDGRLAALPHQNSLYVYDPAAGTWLPVVQAILPDLPVWSPDSKWLAYIGQTGSQKDVFVLHPDGSGLRSLTDGLYPGEDHHLAGLEWLSTDSLGFWHFEPQQRKQFVEIRLSDGQAGLLLSMSELTKDVVAYAPDRQKVAIEALRGGVTELIIANPDGSEARTLGAYGPASIWPLVWSPDGQWLVYSVYKSPDVDPLTHVYVAPRDGSLEPSEIYLGEPVSALVWGPDSRHLIVQGQADGAFRLFLVDAQDGSSTQLEIPSLSPSVQLQGVSWRSIR